MLLCHFIYDFSEALEEVRDEFRNVRSEGPFQVVYFLAPEDERLRGRIQGEVYAVLREMLASF